MDRTKKMNFLISGVSLLLFGGCAKASFAPGKMESSLDLPSASLSKMTVTNSNVADGVTPALVTIEVKMKSGIPGVGLLMSLAVSGSQNVIIPCTTTDAHGLARCKVYSTKAELKLVTATGSIVLHNDTLFLDPKLSRSAFAFVSSGNVQTLPSGHRIVATSGITESPAYGKDVSGKLRVYSSVLGSIVGD